MRNRILLFFLVVYFISISLTLIVVLTGNRSDDFIPETPQWDLPNGAKARIGKGRILDVAYVPESTQFAVASATGIWFYDANTLEESGFIQGNTGNEFSMSFSPDGKTLATVDGGKTIRLWDTKTLEHKATFIRDAYLRPNCVFDYVTFIGDGQTLVSRYIGGVDLWDTATYTHHLELHARAFGTIVFSPDGRLMAANEWSDGASK